MAVTLADVARAAGVSKSAVSRAFTPGASVSAQTRAKVETAAAALGYRPNVLASSLTTGRTKLIGLVSNNFANPFFLEIFDRFTRHLQEAGLRALLINLSATQEADSALRLLQQYNVDGVIVASSTLPPGVSALFRDMALPIVHAFGLSSAGARTHLAALDNVAAGRLAAQTLLARGYRRIGFLGGPAAAATTQDRRAGFVQAGGAAVTAEHCVPAYSYAAGHDGMMQLLAQGTEAEAWFCGDDIIAIGAMAALRAAGRQVPADVGLLGLNDMGMAGWDQIALTTLAQPLDAIVAATVEMIGAHLDDPDLAPQTRLFAGRIVERGSLRPVPR